MTLAAFLSAHRHEGVVLVRIEAASGSTPREAGATMAVSARATTGTIGGGQLEFHCIDIAREMLSEDAAQRALDIPLGPQMGQCCGGRREALARLTCPIGGSDVDDKRPEVIAALTATELVRSLLGRDGVAAASSNAGEMTRR